MNDFLHDAMQFYTNLKNPEVRLVLVNSGAAILPELAPGLGNYAQRQLEARGVEFKMNCKVLEMTDDGVRLSDGAEIPTRTLVWTAGTAPNPLIDPLPIAKDKGRIIVNEFLEAPETPGVWALGDCARVPDIVTKGFCPPTAQHALRQARAAANNIAATLRGRNKKPFRFKTLGQLASLGRRTGVASIMGIQFSGFAACWLWRTIYLSRLPRLERKVRVAVDWTCDLIFTKDLVHTPTSRGRSKHETPRPLHAAAAAAAR